MYYIAGITGDGAEKACDFGFDMIDRIVLDDILTRLPGKVNKGAVKEKRFSYFGDKPDYPLQEMQGMTVHRLKDKYNINVSREYCLATVVKRDYLLAVLRRGLIKVSNSPRWRCQPKPVEPELFSDIVVFNPRLLYNLLGREKYGVWDHREDRARALRVLYKFINFLYESGDLNYIILYNELVCPHWEASGEIHFNNRGELLRFNYFGPGNGQLYRYLPRVEAWERR